MKQQKVQKKDLHTLNKLLLMERVAIINLRMGRLHRIQQDIVPLLQRIQKNAHTPDSEEVSLIRQIQDNIRQNSFLLKSGSKLFEIRQNAVLTHSAMTYGNNAMGAVVNCGPKMLSGSA